MRVDLNFKQAEHLSNFFFDIAKGLVLGGIGSVIIAPEVRFVAAVLATICAFGCLKIALFLLEE